MSQRNIWLSFPEWQLICEQLSHLEYDPFQLPNRYLKEWKDNVKHYQQMNYPTPPQFCFKRVKIHWLVDKLNNPQSINTLCREYWREQDFNRAMDFKYDFIGFVTNYIEDIDMNTTLDQWETIRNQMLDVIQSSDKRYWYLSDLIELYNCVTSNQLVATP